MKIIRVKSLGESLDFDIHPDSAMILPGRPLFMPEFGEGWVGDIYLALRIGRLGKNIARKFAGRYYDAVSVGLVVTLPGSDLPEGVMSAMDSTVVHGEWFTADRLAEPLRITCGKDEAMIADGTALADEAVSRVSEYMTLKMGDIILLPLPAMSTGLKERSYVTLDLDGEQALDLKVV